MIDELGAKALDAAFDEISKECTKISIVIAGSTGAGKSTLLNAMFGMKLAKTGTGRPQTQAAQWWPDESKISLKDSPLRILDTKGLEEQDYQNTLQAIKTAVEDANSHEDFNYHAHICWFCIKESSGRVQESHKEVVELLNSYGIPVIVVLTEAIGDDDTFEQQIPSILPSAKAVIPVNSIEKQMRRGRPQDVFGLDELVTETTKLFPEAQQAAFYRACKLCLDKKYEKAQKCVSAAVREAAAAGATPIPFSDAFLLVPIQIRMIMRVSRAYGIELDSSEVIQPVISSIVGCVGVSVAGRAVVSGVLKMIPGIGTLAGGIISGATAAALTKVLGTVYSNFLYALSKNNDGEPPTINQVTEGFAQYWKESGVNIKEVIRESERGDIS